MDNKQYYSRQFHVYVEPEILAKKLGDLGYFVNNKTYHIDDFTVRIIPFVERGPNSVLEVISQQKHEVEVGGLFKRLNLNYVPIFSAKEFIELLEIQQ